MRGTLLALVLQGCHVQKAQANLVFSLDTNTCTYAYIRGLESGQDHAYNCQNPHWTRQPDGVFGLCYATGYLDGHTAIAIREDVVWRCKNGLAPNPWGT